MCEAVLIVNLLITGTILHLWFLLLKQAALNSFYASSLLTLFRLFGGKPSKQAPVTTAENMKNSTVISNPHATMNHVTTVLESPDVGLVCMDNEASSHLFGGRTLGSGTGTLGSEQVRWQKQSREWSCMPVDAEYAIIIAIREFLKVMLIIL